VLVFFIQTKYYSAATRSRIRDANSRELRGIRAIFFGFKRIAQILDCFFRNIFIIRTVLMIRYFEKKTIANLGYSCEPEKIPEFA
jgi:hypothetical protein